MAEEVLTTSNKITKDAAVAALESLQQRGADLNPYSLAEELQVPASAIVVSGEIMEMLSFARGDMNGFVAAEYERLVKRVQELEGGDTGSDERLEAENDKSSNNDEKLTKLEKELEELNKQLDKQQAQSKKLIQQVKDLESANQVLALSMQDSFQQGSVSNKQETEKALVEAREASYKEGFEAGKLEAAEAGADSEDAYQKGYNAAKKESYHALNDAKSDGYVQGFEEGRLEAENGFEKAKQEAYDEGLATGKLEAENKFEEAKTEAYQKGFEAGKLEAEKNFEEAKAEAYEQGFEAAGKLETENNFEEVKAEAYQKGFEAAKAESNSELSSDKEPENDLEEIKAAAYQKGLEEGRLEAQSLNEELKLEAYQRGFEAGKLEAEPAQSTDEAYQHGYQAGKEEGQSNSAGPEQFQEGYQSARSEMQGLITQAANEAYQLGYDAARQEASAIEFDTAGSVTAESAELAQSDAYAQSADNGLAREYEQPLEGTEYEPVAELPVADQALVQEMADFLISPTAESIDAAHENAHTAPQVGEDILTESGSHLIVADLMAGSSSEEYTLPNYMDSSLFETEESAAANTYDPAATYDPNAAAYDPSAAAYDPNAAAYDPNAAAYDSNAVAYDPNAAAYDPNADAYDPNAAPYEPDMAAYDPNAAAYDPNADADAYDPNAAPHDLDMAAYDPTAAAYDPDMTAYDPNAASSAFDSALNPAAEEEELATHAAEQNEPAEEAEDLEAQILAKRKTTTEKTKTAFDPNELRDLVQHRFKKEEEAPPEADAAVPKTPLNKFVGGKHIGTQEHTTAANMPRVVSADIRRSCKLLGLRPEELSKQAVLDSWKREMSKPGVHPDTGGDTEMAMYLNNAKDTLIRYLEAQAPKLGKVFGTKADHKDPPKGDKG